VSIHRFMKRGLPLTSINLEICLVGSQYQHVWIDGESLSLIYFLTTKLWSLVHISLSYCCTWTTAFIYTCDILCFTWTETSLSTAAKTGDTTNDGITCTRTWWSTLLIYLTSSGADPEFGKGGCTLLKRLKTNIKGEAGWVKEVGISLWS